MVQLTDFFESLGKRTIKKTDSPSLDETEQNKLAFLKGELGVKDSEKVGGMESLAVTNELIDWSLMNDEKTQELFLGGHADWTKTMGEVNKDLHSSQKLSRNDFLTYYKDNPEFRDKWDVYHQEKSHSDAKADENSYRSTIYDKLINWGVTPSEAKFYSAAADFAPGWGDLSAFDDAGIAYQEGHKTVAALTAVLATIGLVPLAGDVIRKFGTPIVQSLKNLDVGPELVPAGGPPLSAVDNLEEIDQAMTAPSEILAGERGAAELEHMGGNQSKLFRQTSTEWEQWKANNLSDEDKLIIPTNNENLANRIAELSPEGREKALAKLEEMWQKNGVTIGLDGRPIFEIDDKTPLTYFAREEVSLVPKKLGEVLKHEELYKVYPSLKDINIRLMSPDEIKKYKDKGKNVFGVANFYTFINPLDKSYGKGPVLLIRDKKVLDDHGYNTLFHEIQHFVQGSEGKLSPETIYLGKRINTRLQEKLKNLNSQIETLTKGSPNYQITGKNKYYIDKLEQQKLDTLAEINFNSQRMNPANERYYEYENTYKEIDARAVSNRIWDSSKKINSPWKTISAVRKFSGDDIIRLKNTKNGELDLEQYIKDSLELAKKLEYENPNLSPKELDKLKTDFFFTKKAPSSYRITVGPGLDDVDTVEQDLSSNYFKEWVIDNTDHLNPEINDLEYNEWLDDWSNVRDINLPLEDIEFPAITYNKGGLMSRSI